MLNEYRALPPQTTTLEAWWQMCAHQSAADSRLCKCLQSQSHRSSSTHPSQLLTATVSPMRWPSTDHQMRWKTKTVPYVWVSSDTNLSLSKPMMRMVTLSHLGLTAWMNSTQALLATMSTMVSASKRGWPGRGAAPAAEPLFESPGQNEHALLPLINKSKESYHQTCLRNTPWAPSWHIPVCCSVVYLKLVYTVLETQNIL